MPRLQPRLALLSDLRARAGLAGWQHLGFVPRDDVQSLTTTDAVDLNGTGTLVLDARSRAVAALQAQFDAGRVPVLEIADWSKAGVVREVQEWRVLALDRGGASALGTATATLVSALVYDWALPGRLRTTPSGGVPTYDLSGFYTPAQTLALALAGMSAAGHAHWSAGTIDRADVKYVSIVKATPLALLRTLRETWGLEPEPARVSASSWTVGLRKKRGGAAAVPTVRATGALRVVTWKRDATPLATAVQITGAGDGTPAHAAWKVASVASNVVGLQDPAGPPNAGPVQIDGQLVGCYLEKFDGTSTQITATSKSDRVTSLVTVASATGVTVGEVLELRADSSGTRLVVLADDAAIAAGALRREVPVERADLDDVRNYVPNARGAAYTGALPDGWTLGDQNGGGAAPTMARITTPAGCPIGDDGSGQVWEITYSLAGPDMPYARLPITPYLDAATGDATFVGSVWVRRTQVGTPNTTSVRASLVTSTTTPYSGTALAYAQLTAVPDAWTRIDVGPVVLGAGAQLYLELVPCLSASFQTFAIAAGQIARGTAYRAWAPTPRGCLLHQAANAELLLHRTAEGTFEASAEELAVTDAARYGDTPFVVGGDLRLQDPRIGLDQRVRVVALTRDRWAGGAPSLTLTAASDPALAQLQGDASPTRVRDILDELLAARAA